ncbi:MAG: hypothetical protein IJ735_07395 [Clostridia bacterium]|nr:hypothetical protein [Clostridia bacterium]
MKKKIIVLFLLVALVASVCLTGCTMVRLNEERQANEVLATVSLKNGDTTLSLDVTRNELNSYVNYMINLYSQYSSSGITYDVSNLIDSGLNTLVAQKYAVLKGMVYLTGLQHRSAVLYKDTQAYKDIYGDKLVPEGALTIAERYAAIASTNETFKSNIEEYMESYKSEIRDRAVSSAREQLTSRYNAGYTVKEDGVTIVHKNEAEDAEAEYADGLYVESVVKGSDDEIDYTKVYLKIVLVKGETEEVVYLPASSGAVETETDADAEFVSNYVTAKIAKVNYEEPVKEDGETTYKTHTAEAKYTLVTPRTAYAEPEEEDARNEETIFNEGSVKFRYSNFADVESNEDLKKIVEDGQIFAHTKTEYASDAEADAYRQFREAKKNMNIFFDASNTKDPYNTLGYYYNSSFESAVLSAVQFELKKAALTENPISDEQIAAQYEILVNKQKEEYSVLDAKGQIDKFAETIGTDLTSAYYVPIEALTSETFSYDGNEYNYATDNGDGTYTINMFYIAHILFKWTDALKADMDRYISDRTDEDVKEIKTRFVEYLKTNKSKEDFATADEMGTTLADAFYVNDDGTIAEFSVNDVIDELVLAMQADPDNAFEIFKQYMTFFNDDSGSFTRSTGYFVAMGDIKNSYDGSDFPNTAIDLYLDLLAHGDPNASSSVSGYAFTSYGLHVEAISFAPFYKVAIGQNGSLGVDFVIDLDGTKFADSIKESLESDLESTKYSEWREAFADEVEKSSSINDKKVSALKSDLGL